MPKAYLVLSFFLLILFKPVNVFSQADPHQKQLQLVFDKIANKDIEGAHTLFQSINKAKGDSFKDNPLYHYLKGRFAYAKDDYTKTVEEYLIAKKLFSKSNNQAMIALINSNITASYIELGNFKAAEKSINEALAYDKKFATEVKYIDDLFELGRVYLNTGDYLKAAEVYIQAQKYYDKHGTIKEKGRIYAQIGLAYDYAGLVEKAENYYLQAIDFRKQIKDTVGLMNTYNNLGIVNKNQQHYQKAFNYYNQSYNLAVASNRETYKINPLINMGVASRFLGKMDDAVKYYNSALAIAKKHNRTSQIITITNNLAHLYYHLKKYDLAYPLAKIAKEYAEEKGTLEDKVSYLQIYSAILSELKRNDEAYPILAKSFDYADSLYRNETAKSMAEISTKYETEKKEQQIKLLNAKTELQQLNLFNQELELEKKELAISNKDLDIANKTLLIKQKENDIRQKSLKANQQRQKIKALNQQSIIQELKINQRDTYLIVALVSLLFIIIISYFIYNRRKLKAQAELQEEINKQQDMAARAVLDAEEAERRRIAGDLHDGVGQMLSVALMNLNGLFAKLKLTGEANEQASQSLSLVNESYDEMRAISHQMMPNALIKSGLALAVKEFLNKIDKDIIKVNLETVGLKERLDDQTETVLYRVIQETVNNVIKHAEANKLAIVIIKDEEGITVTIEDNGKGLDKTKINFKDGIGISNMQSRIDFLKGTLDIDSAPGKGTLVAIHIPDQD